MTNLKRTEKKLWELCRDITRKRYQKFDGTWECYTCGRTISEKFDAHTAHFIPKSICGVVLKYDLRNLRVCCYRCNIHLGGNLAEYYKHLVKEIGQEEVEKIEQDKHKKINEKPVFYYERLIEEYTKILHKKTKVKKVLKAK